MILDDLNQVLQSKKKSQKSQGSSTSSSLKKKAIRKQSPRREAKAVTKKNRQRIERNKQNKRTPEIIEDENSQIK